MRWEPKAPSFSAYDEPVGCLAAQPSTAAGVGSR